MPMSPCQLTQHLELTRRRLGFNNVNVKALMCEQLRIGLMHSSKWHGSRHIAA